MKVRAIAVSQPTAEVAREWSQELLNPEGIIAYCARVSSKEQGNPNYAKLIEFCVREGHVSIMEQASMTLEIQTSRSISPQILRHRAFCFQEFSQRYQKAGEDPELTMARRQDAKNRQNSIDDFADPEKLWWQYEQQRVWDQAYETYERALAMGVAKEVARSVLPGMAATKLYMTGNVRCWMTYCMVRCEKATQLEHRVIADECWNKVRHYFPTVAQAAEQISPVLKAVRNPKEML